MNILQSIIDELNRQRAAGDLVYLVLDRPEAAEIDGKVDLVALAAAISRGIYGGGGGGGSATGAGGPGSAGGAGGPGSGGAAGAAGTPTGGSGGRAG